MFIHAVIGGGFKAGANVCMFACSLLETYWFNSVLPSQANWGIWYQTVNLSWQHRCMFAQVTPCSWAGDVAWCLLFLTFTVELIASFLFCFSAYAHRSLSCRRMSTYRGWEPTCEAPTCWGRCPGCTNSPCSVHILARSSSSRMDLSAMWLKCWSWSAGTHAVAGTELKLNCQLDI